MGQWYEHQGTGENRLWLYSERGLMTYLFCHLIADDLDFVLDNAKDQDGIPLREEIGECCSHTTLTEYELGPQGFGSPDGSFLTSSDRRCFVFVEAKQASFKAAYQTPKSQTPEELAGPNVEIDGLCNANDFNSSINGQLEMRWRFVNAVRAAVEAGSELVSERREDMMLPGPTGQVHELMAGDRFYWRLGLRPALDTPSHWRRVDMAGDLAQLYRRLKEVCEDERAEREGFYLLAVTCDERPPAFGNSLRLFDRTGRRLPTARRVFWLNRAAVEGRLILI